MAITGRSKEQNETLSRTFGGLPIVEATAELRIFPTVGDLDGATPGDPTNCVFARACQRQYGSTSVVFFRQVAYVDLLDEEGNRRVERFLLPRDERHLVKAFDTHQDIVVERAFVLRPPPRSQTLKASREYELRRREALIEGHVSNSERSERSKKGHKNRKAKIGGFQVRDGSGLVQMTAQQGAAA